MKNLIIFIMTNNRKEILYPFNILWPIWILVTYIYSTIVFNLGDNICFEFISGTFILAFAYIAYKFFDLEYVYSFFGRNCFKVVGIASLYNGIAFLVEIIITYLFVKNQQGNMDAYWLGQLAFLILWIGSMPLVYIKQIKYWIVYEITLLACITIFIKAII